VLRSLCDMAWTLLRVEVPRALLHGLAAVQAVKALCTPGREK